MLVCWYFLYLSNKLRMIMIVARIRTMKNRTEDTTMREEVNIDSVSELFIVLVGNIVVCPAVFIHVVVDVMGDGDGFRIISGGQKGAD